MTLSDMRSPDEIRRIEGFAALGMTASVIFNVIPILVAGLLGIRPPSGADLAGQVAVIVEHPAVYGGFGLAFVILGASLIILALARDTRLNGSMRFGVRVGTAAGVIGGALIMLNGFGPVAMPVDLATIDARDHQAAVAAYASNVLVTGRLVTAGFVLFGAFAFIASLPGLRARPMSRMLSYLGILLAIALIANHWLLGPLQLAPALLTFVWSALLGISLIRRRASVSPDQNTTMLTRS